MAKDKEVITSRYKPGQLSGIETAFLTKIFQDVGDISVDDLPYSEEFEQIIQPMFVAKMKRNISLAHLYKEILYLRKRGFLVTKKFNRKFKKGDE